MSFSSWNKFCLMEDQSEKSILQKNIDALGMYYHIDEENAPKILQQIEIGEEIGYGVFGRVFDIKNTNMVIKLFTDAPSLEGDLKRYEKIADQVYKGSASLDDMHYFDYGKLNEYVYYAIMPKIIPIEESPFWRENKRNTIFEPLLHSIMEATQHFDWGRIIPSYSQYNRKVLLILFSKKADKTVQKESIHNNRNLIDQIIKAGYRAYKTHGGVDLHSGNIGYLAEKPDVFFFFDM